MPNGGSTGDQLGIARTLLYGSGAVPKDWVQAAWRRHGAWQRFMYPWAEQQGDWAIRWGHECRLSVSKTSFPHTPPFPSRDPEATPQHLRPSGGLVGNGTRELKVETENPSVRRAS
jgi:hypothetical protein